MLISRVDLEARERAILAPYAMLAGDATREHPETMDDYRTAFARDRARIIHAKSFRRLKGKTQVFVAHAGDHYRNRLSHTLEVAQIARELARTFGVNEDLAECIALAHDLGHTPFGHVGEHKMDELLRPFGARFEHNRQSRRILTTLEKKYPDFAGLNLTTAVLDGLAKHRSAYDQADATFTQQPSLEAQIVDLADEIAYTNHDIDDGLRSGILTRAGLRTLPIWRTAEERVDATLPEESFIHRAVSALIDRMFTNLTHTTEQRIVTAGIASPAAVMTHAAKLVAFSTDFEKEHAQLRTYLFQNFYLSPPVRARSDVGAQIIAELFTRLMKSPDRITSEFATRLAVDPTHIVVADFIAGMTDHYAEEFLATLDA